MEYFYTHYCTPFIQSIRILHACHRCCDRESHLFFQIWYHPGQLQNHRRHCPQASQLPGIHWSCHTARNKRKSSYLYARRREAVNTNCKSNEDAESVRTEICQFWRFPLFLLLFYFWQYLPDVSSPTYNTFPKCTFCCLCSRILSHPCCQLIAIGINENRIPFPYLICKD